MTVVEKEYLDGLATAVAAKVVEALGAKADDRPLLSVKEAAVRLDVDPRTVRGLINWVRGRPPRLASLIVGDGARKIEPAEIDRYLAEQRAAQEKDMERGPVPRTRNPDLIRDHGAGDDGAPEA